MKYGKGYYMLWSDSPDIDEVNEVFTRIGKIKAKLKLKQTELDLKAITIKKEKSRSPWLIMEAYPDEFRDIAALEAELSELEARKEFLQYHKEMFKQYGYNNR
jgi:hypothetical protein